MSEQYKLTPEEVLNPFLKLATTGFGKYPIVDKDKAVIAMQQWAAQQTAAKDEELRQQKEEFNKLLSRNETMTKVADDFRKDKAAMAERIKELEDTLQSTRIDRDCGEIALNKQLDDQKAKVKEHHDFCARQDAKRVEQLKSTVSERDQAFDLLERWSVWGLAINGPHYAELVKERDILLSSRENKKPEQVDIVCPLCNGKGFTWALNRIGDDDSKECPRCKGIGKTTENTKPNE